MKWFLVLALVAVLAGLGWGLWSEGQNSGQDPKTLLSQSINTAAHQVETAANNAKLPIPGAPPGPSNPSITPPPPKEPQPPTPASADPGAAKKLASAESAWKARDYAGVLTALGGPTPANLATADGARWRDLRARAEQYSKVIQRVPADRKVSLSKRCVVFLNTGGKMAGTRVEDKPDHILLRRSDGIEMKITRSQIRTIEEIPVSAARKDVQEELDRRSKKAEPAKAAPQLALAQYCIENELPDLAHPYLEAAYAVEPNLLRVLDDEEARQVFQLYLWYDTRGMRAEAKKKREELLTRFPRSSFVKTLQEGEAQVAAANPRPPDGSPPGPAGHEDAGSSAPPAPEDVELRHYNDPALDKLVEDGVAALKEGYAALALSDPNKPDAAFQNRKAMEAFGRAATAFAAASDMRPNDAYLTKRQTESAAFRVKTFMRARAWE